MAVMRHEVRPATGLGVLHLFMKTGPGTDPSAAHSAVKEAEAAGVQVVSAAILGHKADVGVMALSDELWSLRALQTGLQHAGLSVAGSYVSVTEVSEYAAGMPEEMKRPRLYPQLPPEGKPAWCFYPMSKRRAEGANWYELPYEQRDELMRGHGKT